MDMIVTGKHTSWSHIALVSCLIACLGDLTALFIFPLFYPGYDSRIQPKCAGRIRQSIARIFPYAVISAV
jgi:hypothetical protein